MRSRRSKMNAAQKLRLNGSAVTWATWKKSEMCLTVLQRRSPDSILWVSSSISDLCHKVWWADEVWQLILSAGINTNQYGEDADGIDRHFGVNWLGHFYVVNLLYPLLRKTSKMPNTPAPRIVMESSEMHRTAPSNVHFASLEEINDSSVGPTELYGRTKLAMILGTKYGIVDKVIKPNNDNIYALSVHPGAVNTAMQQQWKDAYPGLLGTLLTNVNLAFGRDVEQGSYSALYAATSPEVEEKNWNGYYLSDPVSDE